MSMLIDVFLPERDARSISLELDGIVGVEAVADGRFRVSIDDRVVNRWVFGRGGEEVSRALERMLDAVGGMTGARVVVDRGVGSGVVACQIPRRDVGLADLILGVFNGDGGYDCGVVELTIVAEEAS